MKTGWFCAMLLVATVGIVIAQSTPEQRAAKENRNAKAEKSERGDNNPKSSPNITVVVKQENASEHQAADHQSEENIDIQRKVVALTRWLVIVGFIQACILAGTIWAICTQTGTSRTIERAWVIASPVIKNPPLGLMPEVGDPIGSDQRNIFICAIKSVGNTPARLIDATIAYQQIGNLEDIPKEPMYGKGPLNELPLVKEDSFAVVATLQPNSSLSKQDMVAILTSNKQFLYAYGRVKYKDVFGKEHETRFGYVYHFAKGGDPRPSEFRRDGLPAAYNRAT
jgi:hypothetical protein